MASSIVILVIMAAYAAAYDHGCSHVLINSQCWLKQCPDETSLQCGSWALNISMPEFHRFGALQCRLVHREIPEEFITQKILPGVWTVNVTTGCDGLCTMLRG